MACLQMLSYEIDDTWLLFSAFHLEIPKCFTNYTAKYSYPHFTAGESVEQGNCNWSERELELSALATRPLPRLAAKNCPFQEIDYH